MRLGENIDKPARFDRISLRFKCVPSGEVVPRPLYRKDRAEEVEEYVYPAYFSSMFLMDVE